jgi:hypothetical protein
VVRGSEGSIPEAAGPWRLLATVIDLLGAAPANFWLGGAGDRVLVVASYVLRAH